MFFDGLTYATIARNLEEGLGSIWTPFYTPSIHPEYFEHPPFSFAIHSVYYRLFGDQPWVDRFYAYTLYGLSVLMIRRLWSLFIASGHRAWIPQLLWTVTPAVIWVHQNNMLEAPLSASTLAVVWLLVEGSIKRNYTWSAIAGLLFFVSLGIKGPVGLFPLVTLPLLAVLFPEHRKASFIGMAVMIIAFSVVFSLFYIYNSDFNLFIDGYLNNKILPILMGNNEPAGSTLMSLYSILKQLFLPFSVLIVLRLRSKKSYPIRRESLLFFGIALSATLPLLFLVEQRHYYFMPSMVYWMMAFAILFEQRPWPWGIQRKKWVSRITLTNLFIWLVAVGLSIFYSKSPSRNKHQIKAFKEIATLVPTHEVQVEDLSTHWNEAAIGARYSKIYLTNEAADYFLSFEENAPEGYLLLKDFPKAKMNLYKKATP
jgi:4-amino-4-deoxy-L-arabinose transferase-like glycosyltransferase